MSSDDLYDQLVNAPSHFMVLDPNPQKDDALIARLTYDLAIAMHNADVVARRYQLRDKDELREYLRTHPKIVEEALRIRALYNSEEATEGRIRTKFLRATEQLIAPMFHLVNDPHTPINNRIDAFKQMQRGAGVDGAPAPAAAALKGGGSAFNLTINFAGGRSQNITGTTVSDPNSIPTIDLPSRRTDEVLPPPPKLSVTTGSEDDEIDEEAPEI